VRVNYITSQSLSTASGGWSGLSHNLYHQLASEKDLQINYAGPVHPPVSRAAKLVSKARRILGGRGRFYASRRNGSKPFTGKSGPPAARRIMIYSWARPLGFVPVRAAVRSLSRRVLPNLF